MYDATVTVPAVKYDELVRTAERIEVVKRMLASDRYVGMEDVRPVLGIEEEVSEDEAV